MTPTVEDRLGAALDRLASCVEVTPPAVETVTRLRHTVGPRRRRRWRLPALAIGITAAAASVAAIALYNTTDDAQPKLRTTPASPPVVTGPASVVSTTSPATTSVEIVPPAEVGDGLYVVDPAPFGAKGLSASSSPLAEWINENETQTKTYVRRDSFGVPDADLHILVQELGGTLDTCGLEPIDLAGTTAWLSGGTTETGRLSIQWPIETGNVTVSTNGLDRAAAIDAATLVAASPLDDPAVPAGFQPVPEPVDRGALSYMAPTPPSEGPGVSVTVFGPDCEPRVIDATAGAGATSAQVMLGWRRYDQPVDLDLHAFVAAPSGTITGETVAGMSARLIQQGDGWSTLIWSPEPGVLVELHSRDSAIADPVAVANDVRRIPPDQAASHADDSGFGYDDAVEIARGEDELGRWGVQTAHDTDPNGAPLVCILANRQGSGEVGTCNQPTGDGTLPTLCVRPTLSNGLIAGILPGTATAVDLSFESAPPRAATVVPIDGGTAWYAAGVDLPDMQGSATALIDGQPMPAC